MTSQQLESFLWKANGALTDVQKQIFKGEETYYEETFSHGNIFRGWEGYLDAKQESSESSSGAGGSGGSGGGGGGGGSGPRGGRVPQGMAGNGRMFSL